jgi:hypothetical protein
VSHTYIQKLVRTFQADPDRMRRALACIGPASFDDLSRARGLTRQHRERGYLRQPMRWKVVEVNGARLVVATKAEERRRAAKAIGRPLGPTFVPFHELPPWARGLAYYLPHNPCDPLAAIKHAWEESRQSRLRPIRSHHRQVGRFGERGS